MFSAPAEAYDQYMGRYSRQLAALTATFSGVVGSQRVLDVGCGPGALTDVLVARLGAANVAAADPSHSFVTACAERHPDVEVREAPAETLPWGDEAFDIAIAQLVINFMADAAIGITEMRRVVRPGGTVAACTWDSAGGMEMHRLFWDAAQLADPVAPGEARLYKYGHGDDLARLWGEVGLRDISTDSLRVEVTYRDFDDFWSPFLAGVGPAANYLLTLEPEMQDQIRENCRAALGAPTGSFTLGGRAWAVRGVR